MKRLHVLSVDISTMPFKVDWESDPTDARLLKSPLVIGKVYFFAVGSRGMTPGPRIFHFDLGLQLNGSDEYATHKMS
jgi:hypothetical protein